MYDDVILKGYKPRIDSIQDLGRDLNPPTDQNYCHKQWYTMARMLILYCELQSERVSQINFFLLRDGSGYQNR